MKALGLLSRFFLRMRYPVSLPEEIAEALGVSLSNCASFNEFVSYLACPSCKPTRLTKFMPREKAEEAFQNAPRREKFKQNTLISYQFNEGWVEFILQFDEQSRLRRIYLQHKQIEHDQGIEIALAVAPAVEVINPYK